MRAEAKKVTDATTINTATAAYKSAREGGNATAILEAEAALIDAANTTGQDAHARLEGVQRGLSRQEEEAYVQAQRADEAKEKAALTKFTSELNQVTTEEDIQAIVASADPSVAPVAQRAATARLQYLEAKEVRRARDAESARGVSMEGVVINKDLPDNIVKAHEAELAALNKSIEASTVNGTIEPTVRTELVKRREALTQKIYGATYSKEMNDYSVTTARTRDYNGKSSRVAISTPTKTQAADIRTELEQAAEAEAEEGYSDGLFGVNPKKWGQDRGEITTEMVNAEFRRQQKAALDAEYDDVIGAIQPDESTEDKPSFTVDEEARIAKAMDQNPGKTREDIVAKLYPNR